MGADPSMEEILASIRRILNEDEVKPAVPAGVPGPAAGAVAAPPTLAVPVVAAPDTPVPLGIEARADDVLVLDETMMVQPDPPPMPVTPLPEAPAAPARAPLALAPSVQPGPSTIVMDAPLSSSVPAQAPGAATSEALSMQPASNPAAPGHPAPSLPAPEPAGPALVSPAAAGAAGAAVEALVRTLARERQTATHRGGPTIEDLVREEVRPLLTQWLDTHLPPLVERLVRAEIERVMGRIAP